MAVVVGHHELDHDVASARNERRSSLRHLTTEAQRTGTAENRLDDTTKRRGGPGPLQRAVRLLTLEDRYKPQVPSFADALRNPSRPQVVFDLGTIDIGLREVGHGQPYDPV